MSVGSPPRDSLPKLSALDRVIDTGRLRLRPFATTDVDALFPIVSDREFPKHMSWLAHATKADTLDWIQGAARMFEDGRGILWAIEHEGALVGSISLDDLRWQINAWRIDRAEVGYWIAPEFHGRGFATEAATAITRFAFDVLGLHKLIIGCIDENLGSKRVIEKLGFRFVGREEDHAWKDGRWWAHLRYEMLAHEFPDVHATLRITRPT